MRILVTNDDGIHAPGLKIAEKIARELSDDVWIIAPETDQSGVSHSLSLSDPLRLRKVSDKHFALRGTPTDCVIMGVKNVLADKRPDLVISGVNRGQNVAEDVIYSGTVAGAMEGALLGIPAVALSQGYGPESRHNPSWATSETLGAKVVRAVLKEHPEPGLLVNINFPNRPASEVLGVRVTVQGRRDMDPLTVEQRVDGRGLPYYWLTFSREKPTLVPGTDLWALAEGYVSVTPLQVDLTCERAVARFSAAFDAEPPLGSGKAG